MEPPDPGVLEAARRGDRSALEAVLRHCRPELCRIARQYCPPEVDPEDAVQESMLLIYRRLSGLRAIEAFPAWMLAIVRRTCRHLAAKARPVAADVGGDFLVVSGDSPALGKDLVAAIARLPASYRDAVILRDVEELALSEIADALQLTLEATKNRIHRGRLRIRADLCD